MGNFAFQVPALGTKYIDYRDAIPGDSYNWSWVRSLDQVRYLAIHHTAGPDTQTPDEIANFHINERGWGGVGYHFIISKNGTVYYVGDLTTARANVLNMNDVVIGICLVGSFISGKEPTNEQLQSAHELTSQLLFRTPELVNVNGWQDVVGHKDLQSTECPGDTWSNWRQKIVTGTGVPAGNAQRVQEISQLYQVVLGRAPDQAGLNQYVQSNATIEAIRKIMTESAEHRALLNRANNLKRVKQLAQEAQTSISQISSKLQEIVQLGE